MLNEWHKKWAVYGLSHQGLQLDGLADTVDGWGGGCTPETRLAIMKDSRLGAFGAVSLVLILLIKFLSSWFSLIREGSEVWFFFPSSAAGVRNSWLVSPPTPGPVVAWGKP